MPRLLKSSFRRPLAVVLAAFLNLAAAPNSAQVLAPVPAPPSAPPVEVSMQTTVAMCMGCHGIQGYRASFPEVHRVPKISGQNPKYIEAALKAYATGDRRHPTMRAISAALNDQEIARVAEYYSRPASGYLQAKDTTVSQPAARVAALIQKGGCVSCHGKDFNTPIDSAYPKLAGQYPDYLFVVLRGYKAESNRVIGRSHPIMSTVVRQFSTAELKAMADYIGSLPGDLGVNSYSPLR